MSMDEQEGATAAAVAMAEAAGCLWQSSADTALVVAEIKWQNERIEHSRKRLVKTLEAYQVLLVASIRATYAMQTNGQAIIAVYLERAINEAGAMLLEASGATEAPAP